jgi:DNA-binding CsgD family transcriptional regulator
MVAFRLRREKLSLFDSRREGGRQDISIHNSYTRDQRVSKKPKTSLWPVQELPASNDELATKFVLLLETMSQESFRSALNQAKLSADIQNELWKFMFRSVFRETIQENLLKPQTEETNPFAGLNELDMEIVRLVVQGKTNQEISEELKQVHLGEDAVHKRLSKIYKKTKTRNRKGLIRKAVECGIK